MSRELCPVAVFLGGEIYRLNESMYLESECNYFMRYIRWRKETREELSRKFPGRETPVRILELLYSTTPQENTWREELEEMETLVSTMTTPVSLVPEPETDSDLETDIETDSDSEGANDVYSRMVTRPLTPS